MGRGVSLLPDLVVATADGDVERADRLATHVVLLLDTLEHHHQGEDLLLWPLLRARAPERTDLLDEMDGQHAALHHALDALRAAVDTWRRTGSTADGATVSAACTALAVPLLEHLDVEEREVLPLVDALLEDAEWGALGERAFAALDPDDALAVLAQMAEDSPAEEWAAFMGHLPPPVQDVYRDQAGPVYERYLAEVRGG